MTKPTPIHWLLSATLLATALTAHAQVSVLAQHNDDARTGTNLTESILTPQNVTQATFGMIFHHPVDDQLYTQPLIAAGISIAGGTHDLLIVTTVNNSVYAFDARDPTATTPLWHINFGAPATLHDYDFGCLDINGAMGIIGTPAIDPTTKTLYVVALTRTAGTYQQRLHALDLTTGADLPMSPVTLQAPGFDPLLQNQRPALFLGSGRVYVGYASHCDKLPYHGFLLGYDAGTLVQKAVLNTSPAGDGASIWQSGQAPSVDAQGNIFIITGNGSWDGKQQFSESFLKLDRDLKLLDWFTPTNHFELDKADNDLDSSGASLIPGTNLVLGGGKEGVIYLLDTAHLGHLGDEHALQRLNATESHIHSLVYWDSTRNGKLLYVWGQRDKERVFRFLPSTKGLRLEPKPWMMRPDANHGHPGAMLSLSADGGRNGILWAAIHATGDSWHESRPGILHAYDADDIQHELWNSLDNPTRDDCGEYSKMAPPTIANGMVYLASFGSQNTGTGQVCAYGLLKTSAPPLPAPRALAATFAKGAVSLTWGLVPGASTYTVERITPGKSSTIAAGLTQPGLTDYPDQMGATSYRVFALDPNGRSAPSVPASLNVTAVPMGRMAH